jgi:hypothetical protein
MTCELNVGRRIKMCNKQRQMATEASIPIFVLHDDNDLSDDSFSQRWKSIW